MISKNDGMKTGLLMNSTSSLVVPSIMPLVKLIRFRSSSAVMNDQSREWKVQKKNKDEGELADERELQLISLSRLFNKQTIELQRWFPIPVMIVL